MSNAKLSLATYSAHDSVLSILNEKAEIEKLFVNAGGLRVPPGINSNKSYLKKYAFVKDKTLHAKVCFLSDGANVNEVWLWTGNLRKSTFESQNILMSFPIKKNCLEGIQGWFSSGCKQHIVFKSDGNQIIDVFSSPKKMWEILKDSLKNVMDQIDCKDEKDVCMHVHVFSPWGSKKVVKEIKSIINGALFSLYTQDVKDVENSWVDCSEKDQRYIAASNAKFPHFKCLFIFRGEDLIWSYVGSANFTESAMLGKKNIEHALFLEGEENNKEQKELFNELKSLGWKQRAVAIKNDEKKETLIEELEYESKYDPQSFIELEIANKVLSDFSSVKEQKRLEEAYLKKNGKGILIESKSKVYKIRVLALEMDQIYVRVYPKGKLVFELSIPRKGNSIPNVTPEDISARFDELESIAKGDENGTGGGGGGTKKGNGNDSFLNVRFPMEFYKGDGVKKRDARKKAYKIICDLQRQKLDRTQKLKLNIWRPLLEKLGV